MGVRGKGVILGFAVSQRRGRTRQRAKDQQELPALVWGSVWGRNSWLSSLQRGQEGAVGASPIVTTLVTSLARQLFPLKLKLIPGAAAEPLCPAASSSPIPNVPISILQGQSLPEKPGSGAWWLPPQPHPASPAKSLSPVTVTTGCCTYSCTE